MRTVNSVFFLFGCVSGLLLASSAFFIYYVKEFTNPLNGRGSEEYDMSSRLGHILTDDIEKSTLSVVISSPMKLTSTFRATINSWGQLNTDWKIAIGGISSNSTRLKKYDYQTRNYILVAESCEDFWPYSDITAKNLYCLLSAIHANSTKYDWIAIISDQTYLVTSALNNLLQKLDSNALHYIGNPTDVCNSYGFIKSHKDCLSRCSLQHPLILSRVLLTEVTSQLSMCLCDENLNSKRALIERHGDLSLGWCLKNKLLLKCSGSLSEFQVNASMLFLDYSTHLWRHGNFMMSLDVKANLNRAESFAMLAHKACQKLPKINTCNVTSLKTVTAFLKSRTHLYHFEKHLFNSSNSKIDFLKWETVLGSTIYNSNRLEPSRKLSDGETMILNYMVHKTLEYLGDNVAGINLNYVPIAYFHHHSNNLLESIIDIQLNNGERRKVFRSYLTLFSGMINIKVYPTNIISDVEIEFIVPISSDEREIARFLKNYEGLCLEKEEKCSLNLIVYGKDIIYHIKRQFKTMSNKYSRAKLNLIEGHGLFNLGMATELGMRNVKNNHSILFLCSVEMIVKKEFLQHCRMNAIEGKQFYYPEFFQFYNSRYLNLFRRKSILNRKNGYWSSHSSTLCLFKSDYNTIARMSSSTTSWRDKLTQSVIKHGFKMMKAPDPCLMREYHDTTCHKGLSVDEFSTCMSVREESLADRTELAEYLFYKEEKCSIRQWNLWDM